MNYQKELVEAVENLMLMAQRREHVMGDPSSLLKSKADLATAVIRTQMALRNFQLSS